MNALSSERTARVCEKFNHKLIQINLFIYLFFTSIKYLICLDTEEYF